MDFEAARIAAQNALANGKFEAAVEAANLLVDAGEPWLIDGLIRRALALENWSAGPSDRLTAAANDWRRVVEIAPASVSFRSLARVQLKLGERDSALVNLAKAKSLRFTPEVMLGFAEFHRSASPPDLKRAKICFFHAALRGRTQGMRGYVEVAYTLDQPFLAVAMIIAAVIATPFLALFLGQNRHSSF